MSLIPVIIQTPHKPWNTPRASIKEDAKGING
jgi:hypothetical protein